MHWFARTPRPILGSFCATLAGCLLAALPVTFDALWHGQIRVAFLSPLFVAPYLVPGLVVWLLVYRPLYQRVPRSSVLWNPLVSSLCGVAAGTLIGTLVAFCALTFCGAEPSLYDFLLGFLAGGIPGGATCLVGSLTAPFFLAEPSWWRHESRKKRTSGTAVGERSADIS